MVATIASLPVLPLSSAAALPLEFKSLRFKESKFEVEKALSVQLKCDQPNAGLVSCQTTQDGLTYASELAKSIYFDFIGDRLASITVHLESEVSLSAVGGAIREKYGGPKSIESSANSDATGAQYKSKLTTWRLSNGTIATQANGPPVNMAFVYFNSDAKWAWFAQFQRAKPGAKKDM